MAQSNLNPQSTVGKEATVTPIIIHTDQGQVVLISPVSDLPGGRGSQQGGQTDESHVLQPADTPQQDHIIQSTFLVQEDGSLVECHSSGDSSLLADHGYTEVSKDGSNGTCQSTSYIITTGNLPAENQAVAASGPQSEATSVTTEVGSGTAEIEEDVEKKSPEAGESGDAAVEAPGSSPAPTQPTAPEKKSQQVVKLVNRSPKKIVRLCKPTPGVMGRTAPSKTFVITPTRMTSRPIAQSKGVLTRPRGCLKSIPLQSLGLPPSEKSTGPVVPGIKPLSQRPCRSQVRMVNSPALMSCGSPSEAAHRPVTKGMSKSLDNLKTLPQGEGHQMLLLEETSQQAPAVVGDSRIQLPRVDDSIKEIIIEEGGAPLPDMETATLIEAARSCSQEAETDILDPSTTSRASTATVSVPSSSTLIQQVILTSAGSSQIAAPRSVNQVKLTSISNNQAAPLPTSAVKSHGKGFDPGPRDDSLTNIQWLGKMSGQNLSVQEGHAAAVKAAATTTRHLPAISLDPAVQIATEQQIERIGRECGTKKRPPYSYMHLIQMAISSKPDRRMTLREIYKWIENKFPYYRFSPKQGWKNSIRHNLSLYKIFVREKPFEPGKTGSSYWTLRSDLSDKVTKSVRYSTLEKSKAKPERGSTACSYMLLNSSTGSSSLVPVGPSVPLTHHTVTTSTSDPALPKVLRPRRGPAPLLPKPPAVPPAMQAFALIPIPAGMSMVPQQPVVMSPWPVVSAGSPSPLNMATAGTPLSSHAQPGTTVPSKRNSAVKEEAEPTKKHAKIASKASILDKSAASRRLRTKSQSLDSTDFQQHLAQLQTGADSGVASDLSSSDGSSLVDSWVSSSSSSSTPQANGAAQLRHKRSRKDKVVVLRDCDEELNTLTVGGSGGGGGGGSLRGKLVALREGDEQKKSKTAGRHAPSYEDGSKENQPTVVMAEAAEVRRGASSSGSLQLQQQQPSLVALKSPARVAQDAAAVSLNESNLSEGCLNELLASIEKDFTSPMKGLLATPPKPTPGGGSGSHKPLSLMSTPFGNISLSPPWISPIKNVTPASSAEGGSSCRQQQMDSGFFSPDSKLATSTPNNANSKSRTSRPNGGGGGGGGGSALLRSPRLGSLHDFGLTGLTPLKAAARGPPASDASEPSSEDSPNTSLISNQSFQRLLGELNLDTMIDDSIDIGNLSFLQC